MSSEAWRVRPLPRPTMVVEVDGWYELAVTAADPVDPRRDLVVETPPRFGGRLIEVLTGTPAPMPVPPRLPDGRHAIAVLAIPAGVGAVTESMIQEP